MKNKLLTLSATIDQFKMNSPTSYVDFYREITKTNKTLKQPVTLGQFAPCKDGKLLDEPHSWTEYNHETMSIFIKKNPALLAECKEYKEALSRVIFEGWESVQKNSIINANGDTMVFIRPERVLYDIKVGEDEYESVYLGHSPALSNLAEATKSNPLPLKPQ